MPDHFIFWGLAATAFLVAGSRFYYYFWRSFTISRWQLKSASKRLTGGEVARRILESAGLRDHEIGDHWWPQDPLPGRYSPAKKTLSLNHAIHNGASLSAWALAAHEAGQVIETERHPAYRQEQNFTDSLATWGVSLVLAMTAAACLLLADRPDSIIRLGLASFGFGLYIFIGLLLYFRAQTRLRASGRAKVELEKLGIIADRNEGRALVEVLTAAAYRNAGSSFFFILWIVARLLWLILRVELWAGPLP